MRGFTLIEIMVVVLIIGMLAALVGPHIFAQARVAERDTALAKCTQYHGAVTMWMMQSRAKELPRSLEDLEAPLRPGDPKFLRVDPDPWGGIYRIVAEGVRRFRICSDGPDGVEQSEDDICYEPREDH